jgi:hypothetical protein
MSETKTIGRGAASDVVRVFRCAAEARGGTAVGFYTLSLAALASFLITVGPNGHPAGPLALALVATWLAVGPAFFLGGGVPSRLAFIETLPVRASSKAIALIPFALGGALVSGLAGALDHWAPWKTATAVGFCGWALLAAWIARPRTIVRATAWLGLMTAGTIVISIGRGAGGWTGAAIAALCLDLVAWLASPAHASSRDARRRTGGASPDGAQPPLRKSSAGVATGWRARERGEAIPYVTTRKETTWFDVLTLIANHRQKGASIPVLIGMLFLGVGHAVLLTMRQYNTFQVAFAFMGTIGGLLGAATSPAILEFLASRPIRRRTVLLATVVPCLFVALFVPATTAIAIVVSRRPDMGPLLFGTVRTLLIMLAWASCFAFEGGRDPRKPWPVLNLAFWVGLAAVALPAMFSTKHAPWAQPPLPLVAAFAVICCVRLWRQVSGRFDVFSR